MHKSRCKLPLCVSIENLLPNFKFGEPQHVCGCRAGVAPRPVLPPSPPKTHESCTCELSRASGWVPERMGTHPLTLVCGIPQFMGMHPHRPGYPSMWGCIPMYWGTPLQEDAFPIREGDPLITPNTSQNTKIGNCYNSRCLLLTLADTPWGKSYCLG